MPLVSEVVIKDGASNVLARVAQGLDLMAAAAGRAGLAEDAVNDKLAKSTRALQNSAKDFESLKRAVDPTHDSMVRLADAQTKLQRAVSLGTGSQAEANKIMVSNAAAAIASSSEYRKFSEVIDQTNRRLVAQVAVLESTAAAQRSGAAATAAQAQLYNQILTITAAYGTEVARLRAEFNPLATAQDAYRAKLRDLNAANEAGIRIQGGYIAALEKTKAAFAGQVRGILSPVDPNAVKEQERLTAATRRYEEVLTPTLTAERAYKKEIAGVDEVAKAGLITTQQQGLLHQRYRAALTATTNAMGASTAATRNMQFALTNLSFQINDVVSGLLMGQAPFRIFAQQAGQFYQIGQQAPGIWGTLGTTIRGWITPMTAAVAGLAALAGGFAILLSRASDNAAMLRTFNLTLEGTGKSAVTTAANVQAAARDLQRLGVTRAEAEAAQAVLLRNPSLNAAQTSAIGTIGANVGARLGLEPVAGIERFTAAVSGGLESTIKLGFALGALSASQATAARDLARTGGALEAQNRIIDTIAKNIEGARKEVMGPAAESIKSIGTAWDEMLDKLSNTDAIQRARDALVGMMQGIANAVTGGEAPQSISTAGAVGAWIGRNALDVGMLPLRAVGTGGAARTLWNLLPDLGDPRANQLEFAGAQSRRDIEAGGTGDVSALWAQQRMGAIPEGSVENILAKNRLAGIVGRLTSPANTDLASSGIGGGIAVRSDEQIADVAKAISNLKKETAEDLAIQKLWNTEQDVARARLVERNRLIGLGATATEAESGATIAATAARAKANIELGKEATLVEMRTAGELRLAEALKAGEAAGLRVAAEEQARLEVRQRGGDVARRTQEILDANTARHTGELQRGINDNQRRVEILRVVAGLQGETADTIARQVTLLQARQELERRGVSLTSEIGQNYLKSVDALSQANVQLQEAQRNQQRLDDGIRQIASTVENTLARSIEDAFSGRKVEDWGTRIKTMLGSIAAQISDALFIRPLLGSLIGALGFGSAAQSFGSFGGLGSLFGGGGGGGSGLSVTQTGPNTFSLSNASSALSIGKSFFGESSPGLLPDWLGGGNGLFGNGGISGFFNNIGGSLGFAQPGAGLSGIGSPFSSTLFGPGNPAATGSLFGSTTFGSFLTGAGAGFGGGMLLNSLLGGNTFGGTVGSGIGSLAGAAIGSIIPGIGTLIGGLLGGLGGGGLGGLFGNSKPSNFASGGLLTLGAGGGAITGVNSSGNAQNDQVSNQILSSVQQFTRGLLQALPGSSVSGSLYTNIGSRDGLIVGGQIGSASGELKFGSAQEAVSAISLQIAKSLEGVSAAFKQGIGTLTDPSEIQDFIGFIAIYDNMKTAADSAFSSIVADTQKIGPFKQALNEIGAIFDEITLKTQQYGLSLAPVVAAEAEAMRRLVDDHNKTIADAILGITDPFKLALDQVKAANKAILDDAIATGANRVQAEKLNALTLDALWKTQAQGLMQLKEQLTTGGLSGLTGAASVTAANDNFQRTLALVRGGNLSEAANLATAGQDVVARSTAAYGNAPQTAAIRAAVLAAVEDVLSRRSFAAGTESTPPGWVQVHQDEWMYQRGGATVLPRGEAPAQTMGASNAEVVALLREVIARLDGGLKLTQAVGVETVGQLRAITSNTGKPPPLTETPRRRVA